MAGADTALLPPGGGGAPAAAAVIGYATAAPPRAVDATRGGAPTPPARPRRRGVVYLRARGLRAASGISSHYDDTFPPELEGVVPPQRFEWDILQVNHALADYWPCPTCYVGGIVCCPCTLGLSLLCPNICVSGAESYCRDVMRNQINHKMENLAQHVEWTLHRSCSGGYIRIEFDVPEPDGEDHGKLSKG